MVSKRISLSLSDAISLAAKLFPVETNETVLNDLLDYVRTRYRGYLLDSGFPYDMVDAVLNARGHDPYLAYETIQAFSPWVKRGNWQDLLDSYARCVRITRDQETTYKSDEALLVEPASKALYQAYRGAAARVSAHRTVDELFSALMDLIPPIRRFFDDVLVMDEDVAIRQNRLGLLQAISSLPKDIVDLTVMEGF